MAAKRRPKRSTRYLKPGLFCATKPRKPGQPCRATEHGIRHLQMETTIAVFAGYNRYSARAAMTKCLTVAVAVLFLGGCRDTKTHTAHNHKNALTSKGQFLVPQEELPLETVEMARALQGLPTISSDTEFKSMLTECGLNNEPDHYKDGCHFWYLDKDFRSETDPQKITYQISIGHFTNGNSELVFYFATIERVFSAEPWRERLWQIDWPIAPVN